LATRVLLDRLAALSGQSQEDVPHELLHAEGGVSAGEDHGRLVVDGRRFAGAHAVQVGGEFVQRQPAGADVCAQRAEFMPRLNVHV